MRTSLEVLRLYTFLATNTHFESLCYWKIYPYSNNGFCMVNAFVVMSFLFLIEPPLPKNKSLYQQKYFLPIVYNNSSLSGPTICTIVLYDHITLYPFRSAPTLGASEAWNAWPAPALLFARRLVVTAVECSLDAMDYRGFNVLVHHKYLEDSLPR